jgi:hypothetical protein
MGAPEMIHLKGQDKDAAPRVVHNRNTLGMSLLVRVRSGAGGAVAVVPFGSAAAGCGTGFRLGDPATLRAAWLSMVGEQVGSQGARKLRRRD